MTPLRLKTVRPFVFHDLILNEVLDEIPVCKVRSEAVEQFIDKFIEDKLIADATKQLTGKKWLFQSLSPQNRE